MKEEGFEIDYISVQNEASALVPWESCLYSAKDETSFAVKYLTPEIKKHNLKTKILIWDHNTDKIYSRASQSYEFEEKLTKSIFKRESNIAGCAFHWYMGDHFDNIGLVAKKYPKSSSSTPRVVLVILISEKKINLSMPTYMLTIL